MSEIGDKVKFMLHCNTDHHPKRWVVIFQLLEETPANTPLCVPFPFRDRSGKCPEGGIAINFYDEHRKFIVPTELIPQLYIDKEWWDNIRSVWTSSTSTWEDFIASDVRLFGISGAMTLGLLPPHNALPP